MRGGGLCHEASVESVHRDFAAQDSCGKMPIISKSPPVYRS